MNSITEIFENACATAQVRSQLFQSVIHVNSILEVVRGVPMITMFVISDYCDGSTVKTYSNGKER